MFWFIATKCAVKCKFVHFRIDAKLILWLSCRFDSIIIGLISNNRTECLLIKGESKKTWAKRLAILSSSESAIDHGVWSQRQLIRIDFTRMEPLVDWKKADFSNRTRKTGWNRHQQWPWTTRPAFHSSKVNWKFWTKSFDRPKSVGVSTI